MEKMRSLNLSKKEKIIFELFYTYKNLLYNFFS